jgi:hypothetical protein
MPPLDGERTDALPPWAEQWRDWWLYADAFQRAGLEWVALCCEPAQRNRWLAGLSQVFDRYARSPSFLDLARHNMTALTAFRRFTAFAQTRQELHR